MNAPGKAARTPRRRLKSTSTLWGRYIPPALQPVPLTPEEQEELRKKEERKDRLHQNYLRRKANGKQKEWGRTLQRQAQGKNGGSKGSYPGRGHGEGHFYHRQPVTQAGATQGHRIGQCRSLTITVQRRMNMSELTYTRCGDYYIPDLKLSEQPEAPSASMAYAATLPKGTPARLLQQPAF